ncbi:Uncharacterised protein [uncultured archaeon]|nr:Uncharacterised protein [uncultured archaeon]
MNTDRKHLVNKSLIGLVVLLTICTGFAAAQATTGRLTLSLQPSLDGDGDIKATSITMAELLGTDGKVMITGTVAGSTAQFDLSGITAGDYFIRVNGLSDDLVPTRIDDPTKAISQFVGQKLRATVIGNLSDPTYRVLTFSKGQKEDQVVVYSDGTNVIPETYAYAILSLKTSPQKLDIRALGTASQLNSYTPTTPTHPSTPTAVNPPFAEWIMGTKNHASDYNATDKKCITCHFNLDTKAATFAQITISNGWCYRCHYGKGGVDEGFIDTTALAATPVPTVTTPIATTAAPTAAPKTPAFEVILAISALLITVLVKRK